MDKLVLSVKEVSQALNIGINQAYALVKSDGFPKIKMGSVYRIPKNEFEQWVKDNTVRTANGADI